ncbi:SDR family NAD(P)-dependent oxidoreductase [Bradyrhizobium genosp. A]|uniref:SDR family NAD(P)-dependent oxidoreductase n=1 Tax=Bradyrhizobium genosp. A TaxID=83626 RepID=UPI003CEFBD01
MTVFPTIIITGATNGIGRVAAGKLCREGGTLVLIARSAAKAAETRAEISKSGSLAQIDFIEADFTDLASVGRAAGTLLDHYPKIDCLINNAGIHAFQQRITRDGLPEMVSVNYFAPWLLTALLCDRIVASAPSRIVTVASEASRRAKGIRPEIDLLDTSSFSAMGSSEVYGRTKLMDIMFSCQLARRLSGKGVAVNCLDPGFNVTGLGRDLPFSGILARALTALRIGSPERGASLIYKLATDPAVANTTGGYYTVRQTNPIVPVAPGGDPDAQQELWAATAKILRDFLTSEGGFKLP